MLCACSIYFVVVLNQAQAQLCSTALSALHCKHVHNVKCRLVRMLQSRASCHTFSSSSVMLSREIFLKTTSFPSLRLYKSTVLKRKKIAIFVTSSLLQSEMYTTFITILHSVPPPLSAFSLSLRVPDQNFVCFSIPLFCLISFHFVLDHKPYPFTLGYSCFHN